MSFGIHVTNTSGNVLIDQDYTNYMQIASTSFSVTYSATQLTTGYAIISGYTHNDSDLVFFNTGHANNSGFAYPVSAGGGATSGVSWQIWPRGSSATVQVKIFRRADLLSLAGSQYGLEVYKADGTTLAFSSKYVPMKVAAVSSFTPLSSSPQYTASGFVPFISANTCFVLGRVEEGDGEDFYGLLEYQTVSADATKTYTKYIQVDQSPSDQFPNYEYEGTVIAFSIK